MTPQKGKRESRRRKGGGTTAAGVGVVRVAKRGVKKGSVSAKKKKASKGARKVLATGRPKSKLNSKKVISRRKKSTRAKGVPREGRAAGRVEPRENTLRLGGGTGLAVVVAVAEGADGAWDVSQARDERVSQGKGSGGVTAAMTRAARGIATKPRIKKLAGTLAALGHPARVAMLVKLLEGPATYRALQKVSGLKAGPLYHHVNQLRLSDLILPKQRDLYALTRGGRNVLVGGLALMSLAGDKRERPAVGG